MSCIAGNKAAREVKELQIVVQKLQTVVEELQLRFEALKNKATGEIQ